MKLPRILLTTAWIAAGLAVVVAWCFMAVATCLTFRFAYGNPPDAYTGQAGDRQAAWSFLIILAVLTVIIVLAVVWPLISWRRGRGHSAHIAP